MKYLSTILLLVVAAAALATPNRVAVLQTVDGSKRYATTIDLTELSLTNNKQYPVKISAGLFICQNKPNTIKYYTSGLQIGVEVSHVFGSVGYDPGMKRSQFMLGVKF